MWEHAFYCGGEIGEGTHERDDSFAFLEFDLSVFDAADLVVDEAVEEA